MPFQFTAVVERLIESRLLRMLSHSYSYNNGPLLKIILNFQGTVINFFFFFHWHMHKATLRKLVNFVCVCVFVCVHVSACVHVCVQAEGN